MKKLCVIVVMLYGLMGLSAQKAFTVGGINYRTTSEKTVEVMIGRLSNGRIASKDTVITYSGRIVIPSTIVYSDTAYTVTSIGEKAFSECFGLTDIYNVCQYSDSSDALIR